MTTSILEYQIFEEIFCAEEGKHINQHSIR